MRREQKILIQPLIQEGYDLSFIRKELVFFKADTFESFVNNMIDYSELNDEIRDEEDYEMFYNDLKENFINKGFTYLSRIF